MRSRILLLPLIVRWSRQPTTVEHRSCCCLAISDIATSPTPTGTSNRIVPRCNGLRHPSVNIIAEPEYHDDSQEVSILVQRFFGHLRSERNVSQHTICAYRDSFRLFLRYLSEQRHLRPEKVTFEAFSLEVILGFLGYIEAARGNTTRNSRLTAIRAFVRFALSQGRSVRIFGRGKLGR